MNSSNYSDDFMFWVNKSCRPSERSGLQGNIPHPKETFTHSTPQLTTTPTPQKPPQDPDATKKLYDTEDIIRSVINRLTDTSKAVQ